MPSCVGVPLCCVIPPLGDRFERLSACDIVDVFVSCRSRSLVLGLWSLVLMVYYLDESLSVVPGDSAFFVFVIVLTL